MPLTPLTPATAPPTGKSVGKVNECVDCGDPSTFLTKHDYHGSDLVKGFKVTSSADCCKKCSEHSSCTHWTYLEKHRGLTVLVL